MLTNFKPTVLILLADNYATVLSVHCVLLQALYNLTSHIQSLKMMTRKRDQPSTGKEQWQC